MFKLKASGLEVLQLTSTIMAREWMKIFYGFIQTKKIPLRMITDMVRNENGTVNTEAAIDWLDILEREFEYTEQVLVYCDREEQAYMTIDSRGVDRKRVQVTRRRDDVLEFALQQ